MYKILIISFLSIFLNAEEHATENPIIYKSMGDTIYNNVEKIESIKSIGTFKYYKKEIEKYLLEVEETKKIGFEVQNKNPDYSKKEYLKRLRSLIETNDYYLHSIESSYRASINKEDSQLFFETINSGFIDTKKNKKEILNYYFKHVNDVNASGVIQGYLDEDKRLRDRQRRLAKSQKTKEMLEKEKIDRIRAKDRVSQEKLEKQLLDNLKQKKQEIRERQKEELFN